MDERQQNVAIKNYNDMLEAQLYLYEVDYFFKVEIK
jgi:hypothetical protein